MGLVSTRPRSREIVIWGHGVVPLHMKHQDQRRLSNDGKRWVTHWVFEIGFSRFQLLKPSCRFTPAGQVSLHFQSFQKNDVFCHVVRDVSACACLPYALHRNLFPDVCVPRLAKTWRLSWPCYDWHGKLAIRGPFQRQGLTEAQPWAGRRASVKNGRCRFVKESMDGMEGVFQTRKGNCWNANVAWILVL